MWQLDGLFRLLTHLLRRSERERGPLTADSMRPKQILLNLRATPVSSRKKANNRTHATQDLALSCAPGLSLGRRPNFSVLVIHCVVLAKLTTSKSDGFVLSCKRTHRLAARTHERPALVNKCTLNGAGSGSSVGLFGVRAFTLSQQKRRAESRRELIAGAVAEGARQQDA